MEESSKCAIKYVGDFKELFKVLEASKHWACRHCGSVGNYHGHGRLLAYAENGSDMEQRGLRLLCSNRHRKKGCGRTISVLVSNCLYRHSVRASLLWALLKAFVAYETVASAWEGFGSIFSIDSAYRWIKRLYHNQSELRADLCRIRAPPEVDTKKPLRVLKTHLEVALGKKNPIAAYQTKFQKTWVIQNKTVA